MTYEELSINSFIQEIKDVTSGSHPRRFCFVLGAGASRSSGIKSGQDLVKVWDKELYERNEVEYQRWRKELGITDENMSNFYSHYYEKRFARCPEDGLSFIEGIMESARPSAGYVMLAYILTRTPHNVVVTTNFDHLVEDAVTYYAQKIPLVVGHEALSRYIMGIQNRPTIIKIHRDLLFDPKSSVKDLEELHTNWQSALGRIFENYHPVFIGYAGNDKSLMDFLLEHCENFANNTWKFPYWMLYKTDPLDGKIKELLERSNGYFIRHNGFDEVMIQLSAKFDHSIPKREDFLRDAEGRYDRLEEAIADFSDRTNPTSIVKSIPDNSEHTEESSKIIIEQGKDSKDVNDALTTITSQSESQTKYHQSSVLIRDERYSDAIELLNELISEDPGNARYHYKLGEAYYGIGELDNALREEQEAIKLNPDIVWAYVTLGQIYEQKGKLEDSLSMFSKAAELDHEDEIIQFHIGEVQEALGEYDSALLSYQEAAELNSDWALPQFAIGKLYAKLGNNKDALVAYQLAIDTEPDWALPYYSMGQIYETMGENEKALDAFRNAVVLDNDWLTGHLAVARVLTALKQYEEALNTILTSINLKPDYFPFYVWLALIYKEMGNESASQEALKKAKELRNKSTPETNLREAFLQDDICGIETAEDSV